jgi:hypothetical protein
MRLRSGATAMIIDVSEVAVFVSAEVLMAIVRAFGSLHTFSSLMSATCRVLRRDAM